MDIKLAILEHLIWITFHFGTSNNECHSSRTTLNHLMRIARMFCTLVELRWTRTSANTKCTHGIGVYMILKIDFLHNWLLIVKISLFQYCFIFPQLNIRLECNIPHRTMTPHIDWSPSALVYSILCCLFIRWEFNSPLKHLEPCNSIHNFGRPLHLLL